MAKDKCVTCPEEQNEMGYIRLTDGQKIHCCFPCYEKGMVAEWLKKKGLDSKIQKEKVNGKND